MEDGEEEERIKKKEDGRTKMKKMKGKTERKMEMGKRRTGAR